VVFVHSRNLQYKIGASSHKLSAGRGVELEWKVRWIGDGRTECK
jgi:hypothetical protein